MPRGPAQQCQREFKYQGPLSRQTCVPDAIHLRYALTFRNCLGVHQHGETVMERRIDRVETCPVRTQQMFLPELPRYQ
ncbi:hypothetical protein D3C79_843650 [compost metagenome]